MKIGDFSKRFNVSASTIRYYADNGILTPIKKNGQYLFTEADVVEMEYVLKLKELLFSTKEIKDFLHIIRLYNHNDEQKNGHLINVLNHKKARLEEERNKIEESIAIIEKELNQLSVSSDSVKKSEGFAISIMDYLFCPICNNRLDMSEINIQEGQVTDGKLKCACGYGAHITDGVIYTPPDEYMDNILKFQKHLYGTVFDYNDFVFFDNIDTISSEATALLSRTYAWMDFILSMKQREGHVVLVPDLSVHYLYKYIEKPYFQNCLIIVSGVSKSAIEMIKKHIDSIDNNLNILYIANTIHRLPIRKGLINLWIDATASYNYSFFNDNMLHDSLNPYLCKNAEVVGLTKFLDESAKSLKSIKKKFPNAHINNSRKKPFIRLFEDLNWNLKNLVEIGSVTNPGEYYDYVLNDDQHHYIGYYATK